MTIAITTDGQLTSSGELYEGNWADWETRMLSWMRTHRVEWSMNFSNSKFLTPSFEERRQAFYGICSMTSPALLQRVPSKHRSTCLARKVWDDLKQLTVTPFRLLELPAEIRDMIYHMAMGSSHFVLIGGHGPGLARDGLPPLSQVNRQIRKEALDVFYSKTLFRVIFEKDSEDEEDLGSEDGHEEPCEYSLAMRDETARWFELVAGDRARLLRSLKFTYGESIALDFTLKSKRLDITFDKDYFPSTLFGKGEKMLRRHAENVEVTSKALKLKGGAIPLALLMDWDLWHKLEEDAIHYDSDWCADD